MGRILYYLSLISVLLFLYGCSGTIKTKRTYNEQEQIKKMFGKLQSKGLVTNGQGGGTSYDTPEIVELRNKFNKEVEKVSNGTVVTSTGIKKHYILDNKGKKRFPMLYLRTETK